MAPAPIQREIGQQLMQHLSQAALSAEILYAFIIIVIGFLIYFSTREFYSLTNHKGIKYFRLAFLFFAIAFFFRSFIKIFVLFLEIPRSYSPLVGTILGSGTVFLFMYFSSLAIFYLVYSVRYKKWNNKDLSITIFHILAIVIGLITILSNNALIILGINVLLLLTILFVIFASKKQTKKKSNSLYIIYILLFVFWMLNIFDIVIPNFFQFVQLLIYLASIGIFLCILYKVLKNIGK